MGERCLHSECIDFWAICMVCFSDETALEVLDVYAIYPIFKAGPNSMGRFTDSDTRYVLVLMSLHFSLAASIFAVSTKHCVLLYLSELSS